MSNKDICPQCGKDNLYITEHNGLAYCFSPGCEYWERKGEYKPKVKKRSEYITEIRELYKQAAQYYHSSLTPKAIQYLYKRGFTDTSIQKLQLGYIPDGTHPMYTSKIAIEAGLVDTNKKAFLANRIAFPYVYKKDITDIRGRAIECDDVPYKSLYHDTFYRGADYPFNYCDVVQPVIITEGEIKAGIAMQYGYNCIAIPGIKNWRKGFKQQPNQEVIILFDSQQDKKDVVLAIRKIAMELDNPKVATLPLFGDAKQDIDSFLLRYGKSYFDVVIRGALEYNTWNSLQR